MHVPGVRIKISHFFTILHSSTLKIIVEMENLTLLKLEAVPKTKMLLVSQIFTFSIEGILG